MPQLVYPFSDCGFWGCFQFGTLIHKAAMNILVKVFVWTYAFILLGKYLRVDYMVRYVL